MDAPDTPPEVTIEPADNGFIVRHHQRGDGKKTEGRTIRRLAMTKDEALGHAGTALGGARLKKKSHGRGGGALAMDTAEGTTPHHASGSHSMRGRARRRRPRTGGRR